MTTPCSSRHAREERGRDVPLATVAGLDRDAPAIELHDDADDLSTLVGKVHPVHEIELRQTLQVAGLVIELKSLALR